MKLSYEQAFNIFSSYSEGLTSNEFVDLMVSKEDKRNASARLSQFVKEGLAKKAGSRINSETGNRVTIYTPSGASFSNRVFESRAPSRKRRRPTSSELIELRRWKADAIKRYPDLGIDPIIFDARQRVADILRSEGFEDKARIVESGELDGGETMRIVLSILRAG